MPPQVSTERFTLVARTCDAIEQAAIDAEVPPEFRGQIWLEVKCGKCRGTFKIANETLDKIITKYGYIVCANAFCAERLYAMPNEDVIDLAERRAAHG